MDGPTKKQSEILRFLYDYKRKEGNSPTYREIAERFGFKSVRSALDHVGALEKKGYLRRHGGRARGIELLFSDGYTAKGAVSVPFLGSVPAGSPEEKTEYDHGAINVDPELLGASAGHRLFALKVDGDSMDGRGIHEGDWIVVDADVTAGEGDMVVALIDGQNTLKTLVKSGVSLYLKAENPSHPDWIPMADLSIQGVVKTVLRRIG